jgi:hypothetical protein
MTVDRRGTPRIRTALIYIAECPEVLAEPPPEPRITL